MFRVVRQGQGMQPFPRANANVRRIVERALLGEGYLPPLQAVFGFVGHALGMSSDELTGRMGRRSLLVQVLL